MSNIILKIVLVGNSSVGKTSLIRVYMGESFDNDYMSTIGAEFRQKKFNKDVTLKIMDTAGQERFRSISKSYYRNSDGIIFVFDITNEESFKDLEYWLNDPNNTEKDFKKILVANKIDLEKSKNINREKYERFAKKNNMKCIETSAKDNINVEDIFNEIVNLILNDEKKQRKENNNNNNNNLKNAKPFKKKFYF